MERKFILDLGIGSGGDYIRDDPANITRIGLDKNIHALSSLIKKYQVEALNYDAEVSPHRGLPFKDGQFTHVDSFFPYTELLYSLISDDHSLWQELYRIIVPNGTLSVVLEVPYNGILVQHNGCAQRVDMPYKHIFLNAQNAGFLAKVRVLAVDEIENLKTPMGKMFASVAQADSSFSIYQINATKNSNSVYRVQP